MEYVIIAIILLVAELVYFRIADRFNIIDKPNERSSHTKITLRGGGVIFLIGAWIWAAFFGIHYIWFMTGLTLIGLVSFADDVHSTPNALRLVVQFTAMMLMFINLHLYESTTWWLLLPALIVSVGIINAYNFMDGINGITGCYSLAVVAPLAYLNHELHFVEDSLLTVTAISAVVFLVFNFRKRAKCFAGDVGSVSIAFILLFCTGRLIMATGNPVYLLLLGVYGADTVLTIIHRIKLGENLGEAHRKHAYQLMSNELKMRHTLVSVIYMSMQLAISFGLTAISDTTGQWIYFCVITITLALGYLAFMKKFYYLHEQYLLAKKS
ncbi:MAG: glycosyltransferase family 4 protein [Muribaculaceae bacterium]|nr:glycosyltransferase family 4 protein [Muribaculaceae bacterium]MDE6345194.1 glycosyltransferase family 4 protein [Muribaculaceae bacterium]